MMKPSRWIQVLGALTLIATLSPAAAPGADDAPRPAKLPAQRVFTAGHSFHMFMPNILRELAQAAGIKDHEQVGSQSIGGSRIIQHWNLPDEKNKAKEALKTGKVDVLTLSPLYHPDEGIDHFTRLALEHNPAVRITVQAFWLPFDVYAPDYKTTRPPKQDRNARTGEELRKMFAEYSKGVNEQVQQLNRQHGKDVLFVVPVGQASIALREKIVAGQAPGLKEQNDLFRDEIGHPQPPLQALAAYCHFAVIYRQSPVGLPLPAVLKNAANPGWDEKLNRLLQELAWEAVTQHPLSGVKAEVKP